MDGNKERKSRDTCIKNTQFPLLAFREVRNHSQSFTNGLPFGRTSKVTPTPWYKGGGDPSPGFLLCFNISERFCLW